MQDDGHDRQPHRLRWLTWALWALALAGLLYLVGLTIWLGLSGLFFPYQLDYGEGTHLHYARELLNGRPIYRPIGSYPYITSNYAPLPFVLAIAAMPLLGVTYAAGRIWTLLAIVAVSAILVAWVRRESGRWLPAVVAALAFAGSPYIYHWAPMFRVDLVGLALTLGGLYTVYRAFPTPVRGVAPGRRPNLWLGLAVVLFVAALYAKQSYIFGPAAAVAYLLLFVDRRRAIALAAGILVLGGGIFVLINALSGGSFWQAMVVANVNAFLWPAFWQQQADFFGTFAVLGLLSTWYIVDKFFLERATPLPEKTGLHDLYLPAALLSVLLAGKVGSWENYFFEALAALALCGGLGLARLVGSRRLFFQIAAPLLVLVQVALMWHTPRVANRYLALTRQSYRAMEPILAQTPDPIFAEDMGLLVTFGKTLDYHSFEYSQLALVGRWDQSWELDQLRDRARNLVILDRGTRLDVDRYGRYTRAFLSELDRNYRHARTVGKFELYEPDPLQHEAQPATGIRFGDQLALLGWSLHTLPDLQAGQAISLTAVWQSQQPLEVDYSTFAHLVDEGGRGWAGDDHQPYDGVYPTSTWGLGEMVRDTFTLTVPPDAPPGLYDILVGWYQPDTQERLPVGEGNTFRVAVLPLGPQGASSVALTPAGTRFGPTASGGTITLEGQALDAGEKAVQVTLRWSASDFVDTDYTVFVHLVAADNGGEALAHGDAPPLGGRWPTSLWLPGVRLDDVHTIPLPADLPPGAYDLLVGLYDPLTGERLRLPDGSDAVRLAGPELGD